MFGQKNTLIIWISSNKLTIMGGKIVTPLPIALPPNVVSNLEVTDADALYALIKEFTSKFPAGAMEVVWIFGHDSYFEHVMAENERNEWDSTVVRFLDLLPFEEVESKVISGTVGTKVVAVNKSLYEALKRGFALQGYITRAESVASELGPYAEAPGLNAQVFSYVMKNMEKIRKNRLTGDDMEVVSLPNDPKEKKKNSSLPILIGVFVLLLGILAYMYFKMMV